MNVFLIVLQSFLAFFGVSNLPNMWAIKSSKQAKAKGFFSGLSPAGDKMMGIWFALGGVGMVLPWALGIAPILTPIAALNMSFMMFTATWFHTRLEPGIPQALIAFLIALMSLFVAYMRFVDLGVI